MVRSTLLALAFTGLLFSAKASADPVEPPGGGGPIPKPRCDFPCAYVDSWFAGYAGQTVGASCNPANPYRKESQYNVKYLCGGGLSFWQCPRNVVSPPACTTYNVPECPEGSCVN